jgi:hypothetical protein
VDFHSAVGFGFWWRDVQVYSSAGLRGVASVGGSFLHDQVPQCFARDRGGKAPRELQGEALRYDPCTVSVGTKAKALAGLVPRSGIADFESSLGQEERAVIRRVPTDPIATVRLLKAVRDLVGAVPACHVPRLEPMVGDLIAGLLPEIMHENLNEECG